MGPQVAVVMGSDSDWEVMKTSVEQLREFGIACEVEIMSAHRSPQRVDEFAATAAGRGIKLIIAAAGMSAALAGVIAARTDLPVIGVPLASGALQGIDALLSTVQMPPGTPVATVGIGAAGARNAALLALRILALGDKELTPALDNYRRKLALSVDSKNQVLRERLARD